MADHSLTTYLGVQFAAYGDGWSAADHGDAMQCRDLEDRLTFGLALYRIVMERAEGIRSRLKRTGAAYDLPAAKDVERLLGLWLEPAAVALAAIESVCRRARHRVSRGGS